MNYKWLKENAFFIGLLLVALLIRFIPLFNYQFSHDELSALSRTVFPNMSQELRFGVQYTDTHPFLIQVFLYYWIKLSGSSEIAVKLPFLLCGVLSVCAIHRFARRWFGLQAARYAGLIVSSSFIFVLYSSYARMYAPGVLISILLLHHLFHLVFAPKPRTRHFLYFGLCCLLGAFNNHLHALFALTGALAGLLLIPKQSRFKYLFTCLAVLLCYLPHLPITLTQLQTGGLGTHDNGWLPPPKATAWLGFLQALFGTGFAGILVLCTCAIVLIEALAAGQRLNKKQWLLLSLFVLNYGIIHLYSIVRSPVLQYSVLLFSAPCLLVFVASFYERIQQNIFYGLCGLTLIALLGQGIFVKQVLGDAHRQDVDMMTIEAINSTERNGNGSTFSVFTAEPYFTWYYESKHHRAIPHALASDNIFSNAKGTRAYLAGLPASVHYLVLGDVSPMLVELAKERFPVLTSHLQGTFYNVLSLCDSSVASRPSITDDALIRQYDLFSDHAFFRQETKLISSGNAYHLDSTAGEFPFAYKASFAELHLREGQWLLAEVDFEAEPGTLNDDLLCISINTADSTKNYFTAARFSDFETAKRSKRLYLQVFIGSDSDAWNKSGELACFVWKKSKAGLKLTGFRLKQLDYNPAKWTLWQ